LSVQDRAVALVPEQVLQAWHGRVSGPVIRALVAVIGLPLAIALIFSSPPLGVYINGVIVGSLYALIAMGLILVYRANRIINFAQASIGASPAVAGALLMVQRGWPFIAVVPIVIAGSVVIGGIVEFAIIRRFRNAPRLILTLATIGVAQLLAFIELILPIWVGGRRTIQNFRRPRSPFTGLAREIGGVHFTGDHLVTLIVVVAIAIGLGAVFRFTDVGLAIRGAAENADRASLLGIPVKRVATVVWVMAALMSAAGVFQRSMILQGLPAGLTGTITLLYGLAPAVIARMQSLPVAFGAGVAIGVIDQTAFYSTRSATLSGALILPIVLVSLLVQRGRLSRSEDTGVSTWREVKEFRPIPSELKSVQDVVALQWLLRAAVVAVVVAAPYLAGPGRRDQASLIMIFAIAGVSLVILTGWGGQISLGQFAFVGVGAAVAGGLAANHHVNFLLALLAAGVVGAGLAVAIGIPAVRLPGLFLAVTTLAFAANTQYFVLQRKYFPWLLPKAGNHIERPVLWSRLDLRSDLAYYWVCVAGLVVAVACARSLRAHRSGRVMIAARDNARAAQSFGINLARTRQAAFAFSGFFAGLAGALLAHLQGTVDAAVFPPTRSLEIFAMAVIGGLTSVGGALAGAFYIVGFRYYLPTYSLLASGFGMLVLLLFFPGGLSELGFQLRDAYLRRVAERRRIHVPSLVADSRHAFYEQRREEEEMVAAIVSDELAEAEEPPPVRANGGTRRRRATAAKKTGSRA
jgi:branched-chain amino acid transport system permease protein